MPTHDCDAGPEFLGGRGVAGGEANQPNTLDTCSDQDAYFSGRPEHIQRIRIQSAHEAEVIAKGGDVTLTVELVSPGSKNYFDFYYTPDAAAEPVQWQRITSKKVNVGSPGLPDVRVISSTFALPEQGGAFRAFRASVRYLGTVSDSGCSESLIASHAS